MSRTLGRRTGERKQHVLELTEQAGKLAARSIAEARRLATVARRRARGRGAKAKLRQIQRLEQFIDRAQRVCEQIRMRLRGEPITDRPVSIFDPYARPIRKGKLGKPNGFGYVTQICEVTENTKRGATRADPAGRQPDRQPARGHAAPRHRARAGAIAPAPAGGRAGRRVQAGSTRDTLHNFEPERTFIAGSQQPGSRRTQRRLARYRTGTEGRISHLKRGYGQRRSGLKDHHGQQTWTAWGILAYNLDTLAVRTG